MQLEADRRRRWHNSGTIPWQFNEPYPMAACTSAVDYWAEPKPAYYAVARAYAALTVTAAFPTLCWEGRDDFEAVAWVTSDADPRRGTGGQGSLETRLVGASGRVYAETERPVRWPAGAAQELDRIRHPLATVGEDIFFLDLRLWISGVLVAHNRYVFTRTADLAVLLVPQPETALDAGCEAVGPDWWVTLRNAGSRAALFVWLEDGRPRGGRGWARFDDNYFCLLPGEKRIVTVRWDGVPESERRLELWGWNTPRLLLTAGAPAERSRP